MNVYIFFACGLIPLFVGFLWYSPKLFGNAWMRTIGKTEKDFEGGNMILIFVLSYIFGVLFAAGISGLTNHQQGVMQLFAMHPDYLTTGTEVGDLYQSVLNKFGDTHRSFGHGALHGAIGAILLILPPLAVNALFERHSWKYILINFGFWLVCMVLIGGVVCAFL